MTIYNIFMRNAFLIHVLRSLLVAGILVSCTDSNDPQPNSRQKIPWNITQVGGFVDMSHSDKSAWIIDTGVDPDHPDLNVDRQLSRSFVLESPSLVDDVMKHGTHVAGIIGAKNNTIGVVGVAAGIRIVSVKVIYRGTQDPVGNVIRGLTYTLSKVKAGDVVNISLGLSYSIDSGQYDQVVQLLTGIADKGAYVVFAAGNDNYDESTSSSYWKPINTINYTSPSGGRILSVGALNRNQAFAHYSNYGPTVNYVAPGGEGNEEGTSILSTVSSNGTATEEHGAYGIHAGTSQAAPHVAGILLVNNGVIHTAGTVTNTHDQRAYPMASLSPL